MNLVRNRSGRWQGGAALQALALLGAGLFGSTVVVAPANAQDFTTGALVGTVVDASGARLTEGTVRVTSLSQGFTRTVQVGSDGTFRVQALPTGAYTVAITTASGLSVSEQRVEIAPGANNTYTFTAAAAGTETAATDDVDGTIVVTGSVRRGNDFGSNTGGLNISNVSELLNTTPIARNQTALILLSPGASAGDSAFGNLASIGGATVAENAYYVNGLNVTNFRTFVGSSNPPIEFYQSLDVKLYGFPAEFGRALGGLTTAVTKSGSNTFKAGAIVTYAPDALRQDAPNTYAANNSADYAENIEANFYLSGPIIKDRLFFYGIYNPNYSKTSDSSITAQQRLTSVNRSPFFGGKLDLLVADGHRLEGTYFRNSRTVETNYDAYNATTNAVGAPLGTLVEKGGGDNFIGSYTGQFTNWLSLSAAYGESHDNQSSRPQPLTAFTSSTLTGITTTANGFVSGDSTDTDVRKFFRADADVFVNLLGSHHFRMGYERENLTSETNTTYSGTGYRYQLTPTFIQRWYYLNEGTWTSRNESFYLQDNWSLFQDRLTLQLGIRNDRFSNDAITGDTYFKSGDQWGPRLGASFDVFGDKRTAIRGTWGRYFYPVATNTNIRLGGAELYYRQRFAYPAGVSGSVLDANNVPAGLQFDSNGNILGLTTPASGQVGNCPGVSPDAAGICNVIYSDGVAGPTDTLVSSNLQPSFTDEWTLGVEHRFNDWRVGLTYINRRLGRTLDDVAIDAAVLAYCDRESIAGCEDSFTGFHQYVLANPGTDITVRLDGDCAVDARQCDIVTLAAADLGYPKAKRNYDSIIFDFEKAYSNGWAVRGSYAFNRSRGNYEGAVKSDNGQDDAGLTQDFDQPGLLDGAYGILPSERKHQFKVFGTVEVLPGLRFGGNVLFESPRSFSCYGVHPTDDFAAAYANASYFCRQPRFSDNPSEGGSYLVRRGSAFKGEWRKQIDLNVQHDIRSLPGSFISVDVFNAFNFKSKLDFDEFGELGDGSLNQQYAQVLGYQAPRSVRLTLGIRFGEPSRD